MHLLTDRVTDEFSARVVLYRVPVLENSQKMCKLVAETTMPYERGKYHPYKAAMQETCPS